MEFQRLREMDSRYSFLIKKRHSGGLVRNLLVILAHSGDIFVVIPVLAFFWWIGDSSVKILTLILAAGSLVSILFIYIIKFTVRRKRPPGEWGKFYRRTDPYSFPSGHAAKTLALSVLVLFCWSFWLGLALLIWAGLVGYSRIALGVHYLSDVLVGFFIGLLAGTLVSIIVVLAAFI